MVGWSSLGRILRDPKIFRASFSKINKNNEVVKRSMSGHGPPTMEIQGSRWQYHMFKDMFHLYFMFGCAWTGLVVGYANIFIGPAQLAPIPEGYEPKYWEYHRHPISRFIARYMQHNPQQDYEKYLHLLSEQKERQWTKRVYREVTMIQGARKDFQSSEYHNVPADYARVLVDDINDQLLTRKPLPTDMY